VCAKIMMATMNYKYFYSIYVFKDAMVYIYGRHLNLRVNLMIPFQHPFSTLSRYTSAYGQSTGWNVWAYPPTSDVKLTPT
jgi:hypothetical protein